MGKFTVAIAILGIGFLMAIGLLQAVWEAKPTAVQKRPSCKILGVPKSGEKRLCAVMMMDKKSYPVYTASTFAQLDHIKKNELANAQFNVFPMCLLYICGLIDNGGKPHGTCEQYAGFVTNVIAKYNAEDYIFGSEMDFDAEEISCDCDAAAPKLKEVLPTKNHYIGVKTA